MSSRFERISSKLPAAQNWACLALLTRFDLLNGDSRRNKFAELLALAANRATILAIKECHESLCFVAHYHRHNVCRPNVRAGAAAF
jgi:hypothetical protein